MRAAVAMASIFSSLTILVTAPQGTAETKEPILFRYKGKVGDIRRSRSEYVLRMTSEIAGGSEPRKGKMEFTSEATYTHKIVGVDSEGNLEIETVKEKGTAAVTMDDTKREQPDQPFKRVIKMNNRGKVLEEKVEGREESDEEDTVGPVGWLEKLAEETVANIAFPEKPIKVGDTWDDRITVTLARDLKVAVVLRSILKEVRFLGKEKRRVGIIQTTVNAPFSATRTRDGLTMSLTGQFLGTFTLHFDPDEGDERQAEDEMRLAMEVVVEVPGKGTFNQTHRLIARSRTVRLD